LSTCVKPEDVQAEPRDAALAQFLLRGRHHPAADAARPERRLHLDRADPGHRRVGQPGGGDPFEADLRAVLDRVAVQPSSDVRRIDPDQFFGVGGGC
jgi:hypothetical protein